MPSEADDTSNEMDLGVDAAVQKKAKRYEKGKKGEGKPFNKKAISTKKYKAEASSNISSSMKRPTRGVDQQDAVASDQVPEEGSPSSLDVSEDTTNSLAVNSMRVSEGDCLSALESEASSALPSIQAFLENPAKTAQNWLKSLPTDSDFELFLHHDAQEVFQTLMDYVKRLQIVNHVGVTHRRMAKLQSKNMNRLLEGVRGVGKTRIVQAVCRFIDAMRERYGEEFHVVSFYYNCEKVGDSDVKRPRVLVAEMLDRYIPGFSSRSYKDMRQIVRAAFAQKIRLFVVFDELQCKYVPLEHRHSKDYCMFVNDIHELVEECGNNATVITGSSVRAKRLVFHKVDDLEPEAMFIKNYSILNSILFSISTIHPVRDRDAFTKVIDPEAMFDAASVSNYFYHSGGVGRYMCSTDAPDCSAESYFGSTDLPLECDVVLRLLWASGLLEAREGRLSVDEKRADAVTADPWSTSAVNKSELLSLLGVHTETPLRILDAMRDESLLYVDDKSQVNFFYPCHAVMLARSVAKLMIGKNTKMARFVHLLVSSGCQDGGSLEYYAQRDILEHAISARGVLAGHGLKLVKDQLSFSANKACLGSLRITNLDDIPLDTVFERAVDNDSDAIWFEQRAGSTVAVHILHIKAGANDKTLVAGCDPRSTNGIATLATIKYRLIKAFVDIKSKLELAGVNTSRLELASLHLLSTKKASDEGKAAFAGDERKLNYADRAFFIEGRKTPGLQIHDDVDALLPQHAAYYKRVLPRE